MWAAVIVAAVPTALVLLVPDIWRLGRQPVATVEPRTSQPS
jgi:hypothetical protein